jgi:hypothetical protein
MTILLNVPITTAVTASVTTPEQFRDGDPQAAIIQGTFTYGSGGTTADAWVQISVDEGGTWTDVANFHFTTASARFLYNLSALTPVTTEYVPTDGTLAANTSKDGFLAPLWRVKWTTAGTYAGGTILRVDVAPRGRMTS